MGGLLCEADYAEQTGKNGGMVLLTPEYTRYLMKILKEAQEKIARLENETHFRRAR